MELSLDTKDTTEDGTVLLSGIQALVRLPMDQHRADAPFLKEHEIRFLAGVNEDLGATAVFGSQIAGRCPAPLHG